MKVPIPLNSSLCTDSHKNEIKNPQTGNDLFSRNQSYFINSHLTNPKKKIISEDGYITTRGNILTINRGSIKTQIFNGSRLIADILSLGIENTTFLDKDDAVIHDGSLWTVEKTLNGYIIEQTDLMSHEVTRTEREQDTDITSSILDVKFIRNTHKIITRNNDGSIRIDGVIIPDSDNAMANYFNNFLGEFTAVEINGKITFGFNNPSGVKRESPNMAADFVISQNTNSWVLSEMFNEQGLDHSIGYLININIGTNVLVGANNGTYAMDLFTGMLNPELHTINITMGAGTIISGYGGNGSGDYAVNPNSAQDGGSAILCGSELNIYGLGGNTLQGGGGGGGMAHNLPPSTPRGSGGGGGGAGQVPGAGGSMGVNVPGAAGTLSTGGAGGRFSANVIGGAGGYPGQAGVSSTTYGTRGGAGGSAIVFKGNVAYNIASIITVLGSIRNI